MARLWKRWRDREEGALASREINATGTNAIMRRIHEWMPAILPHSQYGDRLDPENRDTDTLLAT